MTTFCSVECYSDAHMVTNVELSGTEMPTFTWVGLEGITRVKDHLSRTQSTSSKLLTQRLIGPSVREGFDPHSQGELDRTNMQQFEGP